ncbi:MAG: ABC transporter permease [Myxococcales bacterium]|nr:ABC transporter permease [Myxococcales bacterium]USN50640.1 MAG: ABC transporter permease [Myxococcales bacterium]
MHRLQKRALRHFLLLCGLTLFFLMLMIAIFGPLMLDPDGIKPNLSFHLMSPQAAGRLGYGINGIDVLTWLVYGTRMSLLVALLVTSISISLGIIFGAIAGYFGGSIDAVLMRISDIILAFPGLLLALYLATVMPPSIFSLVFALSASGWVSYARLVRARVYEIKDREYVMAAIALGASTRRVIVQHILPNIMGPIIVQASYGLSAIILAEAGLTFLGLGLPIGTPSWGALLDQGVANLFSSPYLAIFPGICIALSVLAFNFLGDGLRDILDPKSSLH